MEFRALLFYVLKIKHAKPENVDNILTACTVLVGFVS